MKRYIRSSKEDLNIHAVPASNGEVEDVAEIVGDTSKIIVYNSWNDMLHDRDDKHTYYIRQNGDRNYEIVKYSRWSKDLYTAYLGPQGYQSLQDLYDRYPNAREFDVCLVKF